MSEAIKKYGWKTITGAILYGLSAALVAGGNSSPNPELADYLTWIGQMVQSFAGPLAIIGIGDKIRKMGEK